MLEFSKNILRKVSFDKILFKKELVKNIKWLEKKEVTILKFWCLASFNEYENLIKEVFDQIS